MLFFSPSYVCLTGFLLTFWGGAKIIGGFSGFDILTMGVLGFASLPLESELGFEGCLLSGD